MAFNYAFEKNTDNNYDLVISCDDENNGRDINQEIKDLNFKDFSTIIKEMPDINNYSNFSEIVILDNLTINKLSLANSISEFKISETVYSTKDIKVIKFKKTVSVKTLFCDLSGSEYDTKDKLNFVPYDTESKIKFISKEEDEKNFIVNLYFQFYNSNIINFQFIKDSKINYINNGSGFSMIKYYECEEYRINGSKLEFNNTFIGNLDLYYEIYYHKQSQNKEYMINGNINNISLKVNNYNSDVDTQTGNSQILKFDISNLEYYNLNCQFGTYQIIEIYDSKTHDYYETDKKAPNVFDIINDNLNNNKNYFIDSDNLKVKSESVSNDNNLSYILSNKVESFEHELKKGEKLTVGALKTGDKKPDAQIKYILKSKTEKFEREKAKDITFINGTDQEIKMINDTSSENIYIYPFKDVEETTITEFKDEQEEIIEKVNNECDNKYILDSYSQDTKEVIKIMQQKITKLKFTNTKQYLECLKYLENYNLKEEILYTNKTLSAETIKILQGLIKVQGLTTLISEENPSHTLIIKSSGDGRDPTINDSFKTEIKGDIKIINETINEQTINFEEKENQNNENETAYQIQINKLTVDSKSNVKLSFPKLLTKGDPDIGTVELLGESTISFENLEKTTKPITLLIPYGKDISDVIVGDIPSTLEIIKENAPQTTDEQLKEMENKIDELTDKINNLNSKLNKALAVLILTNNNFFN